MKRIVAIREITALALCLILFSGFIYTKAFSEGDDVLYYRSVGEASLERLEPGDELFPAGDVKTAYGVTEEMCRADYWFDKSYPSGIGSDTVLLSQNGIKQLNEDMLKTSGTNMYDLESLDPSFNADSLKKSLASGTVSANVTKAHAVFADEVEVTDIDAWYRNMSDAITATGYTGENVENKYAVAVKRTEMKSVPTPAYVGYFKGDTDNEVVISALNVNEPFVARQRAVVDGHEFLWGYSNICSGWVASEDLAICSGFDEWTGAWKIDPANKDFIVVTENQIRLEPTLSDPALSEVKLTFATILKLVPDADIPEKIEERGAWNNYVVYLPVRNPDGSYKKLCALISQHYQVFTGFPDMTQKAVLKVAFNNLGDRYGWGGMMDSMDCSLFTRNVYRCFGLELPRNTTWQQLVPGRNISLKDMSDEDKLKAISRMPSGTLLFISGHTMLYTGMADYIVDGVASPMAYVISDSGSLSDSVGEMKVQQMYSVILNPLTARRKNGSTWLQNITSATLPVSGDIVSYVNKNIENPPETEPVRKVPANEGQACASSRDTLPVECFLGSTKNLYISFSNVDSAGIRDLTVSVLKGSSVTTKSKVTKVDCDRSTATVKINKKNSLATVTLKKSGTVSFSMEDGRTYVVSFTVESPKARGKDVKNLIAEAKEKGTDKLTLGVEQLFGTGIDGGKLEITSQKADGAVLDGNKVIIDLKTRNTIKLKYTYLEKKYAVTVSVP